MTATDQVILVDEQDNPIGVSEKLAAHQQGLCHRAFSVFVIRQNVTLEILLQQRAGHKYHTPSLWTNTCCSHPRPDEDILTAGKRRLREEMGIDADLKWLDKFHYIASFDNGLTENEVDHVLIGTLLNDAFTVNPEEVEAYRWITLDNLKQELASTPDKFTPWLSTALTIVERNIT